MSNTERCPRGHEREMRLEFSRLCDECGLAWLESEWFTPAKEAYYANRLELSWQEIKRLRKEVEKWKSAAHLWQMEAEANEEEVKNWMRKADIQ